MATQVPLSLQVFHSRNEYEAQRLNRTEQIRLRDLHDVLKREEKLYVKDHALCRQKFNSHYLRHRSEPGVSSNIRNSSYSSSYGIPFQRSISNSTRSDSLYSRASLFSAPGKLQTNRSLSEDSSLASRMCSSMGEISTMTRFQRIQRKFSIASFTEHGLLTARGSKMANNIDQVRKVLFRNSGNVFPKVKQKALLKRIADEREKQEERTDTEEEDNELDRIKIENENNNNDEKMDNCSKKDIPIPDDSNSLPNTEVTSRVESSGDDTPRDEVNATDRDEKERSSYSLHATTNTGFRKGCVSQNKKKVTIQWNNPVPSKDEDENITDVNLSADRTQVSIGLAAKPSKDFSEWRSILSRKVKNLDPLQQRINLFLADQSDFNRVFPKNFDGVPKTSALQKELADIGKEKREQEKKDRKKKNEIVLEVLNKLGIEDENILSNYLDC